MTTLPTTALQRFRYEAQSPAGRALSGAITAGDLDEARGTLEAMGLRIVELEAQPDTARRAAPLRGSDFLAFNQQLAQLTDAGLPIEQGLRLIAQDMRSAKLAESVRRVAEDLEQGAPLAEAFERHRGQFPPLYGRLIDAGVRSNRLPGVLFNLGRHLDLVQRLRAALWHTAAYPIILLLGLVLVLGFIGVVIVPPFEAMMADFDQELPTLTAVVFELAGRTLALLIGAAVVAALIPLAWGAARASGRSQALVDHVLLPIPLIGPILRRNLVARWCDALRLGVEAGLDLPAAIGLAGDATASPLAQRDGERLVRALEEGRPINEPRKLAVVPATVPAAIHLAAQGHDLPGLLANLAAMYQEQAEMRLSSLQALLTPMILLVLAFTLGGVVAALFLPLIKLLQSVM